MNTPLITISPPETHCKCCGTISPLYGVVDFHHHYGPGTNLNLPLSGIPVYYYRCPSCGFIFTTAFDQFTHEDFNTVIYNDDYIQFDPEFEEIRPASQANAIAGVLADSKDIHILDYGSGNGNFAQRLRTAGFTHVDTYDPFYDSSVKPEIRYDCITCFEVVEHAHRPQEIFGEMVSLLKDDGILVFSTLLQPADINEHGLNWWYALPRNGHVSLFSPPALGHLAEKFGFSLMSWNNLTHVMCRRVPSFAKHFIPEDLLKK